jgi:hypothetical protein
MNRPVACQVDTQRPSRPRVARSLVPTSYAGPVGLTLSLMLGLGDLIEGDDGSFGPMELCGTPLSLPPEQGRAEAVSRLVCWVVGWIDAAEGKGLQDASVGLGLGGGALDGRGRPFGGLCVGSTHMRPMIAINKNVPTTSGCQSRRGFGIGPVA